MRRRPAEHRRPSRRRVQWWIWCLLGVFAVAGAALFVFQHNLQQRILPPGGTERNNIDFEDMPAQMVNFTEELLSSKSFARQLADQMTLAKAYIVIAKEQGNFQLAWEFSSLIRSCQRLLSEAAVGGRAITWEEAHPIVSQLAQLIYKAQDLQYDISTTILTLKNHALALEERAKAATIQSAEFGQLAAEAVPRNLHCLSMRLTEEWFRDKEVNRLAKEHRDSQRLVDNNLYHFCIFSDNVLATSVVVNSTVSSASHPTQLVFHIVTSKVHYLPMLTWFLSNDFKGSTVEVRSVEELSWLYFSYSPLIRQLSSPETKAFYLSGGTKDLEREVKFHDPKYVSLLNHLRFYIPQIYPQLEKVVFLDDDVVVQKDLIPLFSVELHSNIIGAVETCLESFHRLHRYLNFSHPIISAKFDPQACAWAFGMNIFDLVAWKKANVTAIYHYWQEHNADLLLWRTGTLPVGLLTFYGAVEPLDRRWHVLGLGYDLDIDERLIESAAVVHYSGNMKPWHKFAIRKYRHIWERYVNSSHPFIRQCMVH